MFIVQLEPKLNPKSGRDHHRTSTPTPTPSHPTTTPPNHNQFLGFQLQQKASIWYEGSYKTKDWRPSLSKLNTLDSNLVICMMVM